MKTYIFFILFTFFYLTTVITAVSTDYFIDSETGDDSNSGTESDAAWASIEKINSTTFAPDDRILFHRGQTFEGMLFPLGSGEAEHPIQIDAYDSGSLPIIQISASNWVGLYLADQEYWRIQNLEIVGPGEGVEGSNYAGIYITINGDEYVSNGIQIIDCVVRDIGGMAYDKYSGLISLHAIGSGSYFNNVLIDGCTAYNTDQWAGITIGADDYLAVKNTNVEFNNCEVYNTNGDGITQLTVQNGAIRNCVVHDVGNIETDAVGTPNGIWHWNSTDTVVEYCEVYRVHSPTFDGGAFDIDYGNINCTVQYNYAHDNDGYGVAVFGATTDSITPVPVTTGAVVRYNIFSNNGREPGKNGAGQGDFKIATWNNGFIDGMKIYNNISYWNPASDEPAVVMWSTSFTGTEEKVFKNNIIITTNTKVLGINQTDVDFDNNLYWASGQIPLFWYNDTGYNTVAEWNAATGLDASSLTVDPKVIESTWSENGMPTIQFNLDPESPAIDAGANVGEMGLTDFFGNPIPQNEMYDIGAFELLVPVASQNLLLNGEFETTGLLSEVPGWDSWGFSKCDFIDFNGGMNSADPHLTHCKSKNASFYVYTYQNLTDIENGVYSFRAFARKNGTGTANVELQASGFGGDTLKTEVPESDDYELVEINPIEVTTGNCTVGFWTHVSKGKNWPFAYFDKAEFVKQ